ncbi:MAG: magnesium transporter [Nocardioidaceae bacterium]|jgi:magnesium transporter|nr:magnesium transporter [Nocardioidaceae bacterium]
MTERHGAVRTRLWRDGSLIKEDFPFEDISDYIDEDGCLVWVDICDAAKQQLNELADELTLDPHAVEDSLSNVGRAKATRYATHTFLTAYATSLRPDDTLTHSDDEAGPEQTGPPDQRVVTTRVAAFILRHGIVTVRTGTEFDMDQVVQRWDDNSDLLKYGVGALVHGLLDVIVDGHFEAVQAIDDSIESLEDGLFDDTAISREVQRRTYQVRKDLVELRRVVLPMREVVNSVLRNRKDIGAPSELDSWYDDLYDHVLRASEWTESLRDMVTTIFETNLSLQDARLNTVMKKLTSWAAIIAVPTAVTGYFGQNVPYPGFAQEWGFLLSCVVIITMAGALYVGFKRRGWL